MPFISARVIAVLRPDTAALGLVSAGEDQSVLCATLVQLEAIIIGDITQHTFEWEQSFGTPVTLINPDTLTPSFVNPQTSEIIFTFYTDRNTPFEQSDEVLISRRPTDIAQRSVGAGTDPNTGGTGSPTTSNVVLPQFRDLNVRLTNDTYNYPAVGYSPIYTAIDLDKVREDVYGSYWLMNDIDLSGYANWNPIGTANKPFVGELQGNGYVVDNLSITSSPILVEGGDALWSEVQLLAKFEGSDGATMYTELSTNAANATFANDAQIDDMESRFGSSSALFNTLGSGTDEITFSDIAAYDHSTGDWTHEGFVQFNNTPNFGSTQTMLSLIGGTDVIIFEITDSSGHEVLISGSGWSEQASISSVNSFQWYHWAVCREAGTIRAYWDGNYVVSDLAAAPADMGNASQGVRIGALDAFGTNFLDGWIDNYRMTIGTARYTGTGSITVPTTDFDTTGNTYKDVGLFSHIGNGALIEKVGITNAAISDIGSSAYRGILAGRVTADVTVSDCYTEGTVASGSGIAGGVIGDTGTDASSTFTNTYADATITGGGTVGGWAGTFSGTPTYVENYSNTTKTVNVVGAGAPGGTEVSGLTTAQLTAEANYTGWDFTSTWEIDEGVSPATLQEQTPSINMIRTGGFCDNYMISWERPDDVNIAGWTHSNTTFAGSYLETRSGTNWINKMFVSAEQNHISVAAGQYRLTTIWRHDVTGLVTRDVEIIHTAGLTAPTNKIGIVDAMRGVIGSASGSNLVITISNPRKISKNETDTFARSIGTDTSNALINLVRTVGVQKDLGIETFKRSIGDESNGGDIVIARNNGASIG